MDKRVLLIDDESALRRTLTLTMYQRGWETEPCENGISGLKKLDLLVEQSATPTAVIVDCLLPDIAGTQLTKIIKAKYPSVPVILITGYKDKVNKQDIDECQAHSLLEKPFSADELTECVETLYKSQVSTENKDIDIKKQAKTLSAYVLITLKDNVDFFDMYHKIYSMDNCLYCDATKGGYDVIALIQARNIEEIETIAQLKIGSLAGVKSVELLKTATLILEKQMSNIISSIEDIRGDSTDFSRKHKQISQCMSSYILIEASKEHIQTIYPSLRLSEDVVSCDYTEGKYNLVLLIGSNNFGQTDKFIKEKIIPLTGVLRVKKYPIISLLER